MGPKGSMLMRRVRHLLLPAPILAALSVGAAAEDGRRVQVALTPYLWVAGVSGTLGTTSGTIPDSRVGADFGDILSNLNAIPLMLAGEIRQGRLGLMTDLMVISVEAGADMPSPAFSGGEARLRGIIGSVLAAWRVAETERGQFDLGVGLRAFGVSTRFTLDPGLLPGRRIERDANWVNPVVGLRYRHDLGAAWATTLYGDIGGGAGDLTWQAMATIDYRLSDRTTLRAGYRWLSFERESGALSQDIGLGGPILGATIRF
jgi:opacity protein-like surface antigen